MTSAPPSGSPPRPVRTRHAAGLVAGIGLVLASLSAEAGQRGPEFGSVRYRSEIRNGQLPDNDDYVTPLVAGEVLSVTVAAEGGSDLLPLVSLLDASGTDQGVTVKEAKGGKSVAVKSFVVPTTGEWTVRIRGKNNTQGAYSAKFAVKTSLRGKFTRQTLGGDASFERTHTFEGVRGAVLDAVLKRRDGAPAIAAVLDPIGNAQTLPAPGGKGAKIVLEDLALAGRNGTYSLTVSAEDEAAAYDLQYTLLPPERPKGTIVLSGDEPRVAIPVTPFEGNDKTVFRISGAGFSQSPFPRVFFGDEEATVLQVVNGGTAIDVGPPYHADGALVELAVQNPDGQASVVPGYFRYVPPDIADLATLTPGVASLYVGETKTFTITLDRLAPVGGTSIALTASGGTVPVAVTVSQGQSTAQFGFQAGGTAGPASVTASLRNRVLTADLTVVALPGGGGGGDPPPPLPDEIDLSGWSIAQADLAPGTTPQRSVIFPSGTKMKQGEYIVVARAASKAAFEAYWGVTLGANVQYVCLDPANANSSLQFPTINGYEIFSLRDVTANAHDGPSVMMRASAGVSYVRTPGVVATNPSAWTQVSGAPGTPTPGSGVTASGTKHGVFVSEFSDASGTGNFIYEFVEIHFDGNP